MFQKFAHGFNLEMMLKSFTRCQNFTTLNVRGGALDDPAFGLNAIIRAVISKRDRTYQI